MSAQVMDHRDGPGFGETPARFPEMPPAAATAPLWVADYSLTPSDMMAWLAVTRAERRATRALVASAFLAGIMGLQVLTGRLPVPAGRTYALAEAAVILMLPVGLALWTRRRALRARAAELLAAPVPVRMEVWPDRLVETRSGDKPVMIRMRHLNWTIRTRHHLLGETEAARLILPRRAVPDDAAMQTLAAELEAKRD